MRRTFRQTAGIWLLFGLLAAGGAAAGEKTRLVLPGRYRNYEIPAFVVGGKTLPITSEKGDQIRYEAPFGWRSSACGLTVGGNNLAIGMDRLARDYVDFCRLKRTVIGSERLLEKDDEMVTDPRGAPRVLFENRTAVISENRWRERNTDAYSIEALALAYDLPVRMTVLMRDRDNAGRESELRQALQDWAERVRKANQALPQEVTLTIAQATVAVPFPAGYDRYYDGGTDSHCWFTPLHTEPLDGKPDLSAPFLDLARVPDLARRVTTPAAFAELMRAFPLEETEDGDKRALLAKGRKHFMVREDRDGAPAAFHNLLFVKSRLVVLSYRGAARGQNPARILDEWRRETFRANGEVAE